MGKKEKLRALTASLMAVLLLSSCTTLIEKVPTMSRVTSPTTKTTTIRTEKQTDRTESVPKHSAVQTGEKKKSETAIVTIKEIKSNRIIQRERKNETEAVMPTSTESNKPVSEDTRTKTSESKQAEATKPEQPHFDLKSKIDILKAVHYFSAIDKAIKCDAAIDITVSARLGGFIPANVTAKGQGLFERDSKGQGKTVFEIEANIPTQGKQNISFEEYLIKREQKELKYISLDRRETWKTNDGAQSLTKILRFDFEKLERYFSEPVNKSENEIILIGKIPAKEISEVVGSLKDKVQSGNIELPEHGEITVELIVDKNSGKLQSLNADLADWLKNLNVDRVKISSVQATIQITEIRYDTEIVIDIPAQLPLPTR